MLPEQQDILWTFVTLMCVVFSVYAFISVILNCREREGANTKLWGTIFAAGVLINLALTNHMFGLNQMEQLGFVGWQMLAILAILLIW